ncbi:hypothetical protein ACLB2K_074316 [Fragaria x ananassa]
MVKTDMVSYLLTRSTLSGRLARWLLQLSEFDITWMTPKAIKGQAVINMITLFSGEEGFDVSQEILGELPEISVVVEEEGPWTLHFDGFGIPYKIVTDNGTHFVNQEVSTTLKRYGIKDRRSTPYYPQGNGQAEATNKTHQNFEQNGA